MSTAPATLPTEVIEAIVHGYHGDPFGVLGPHEHEGSVITRVFLPQATSAELLLQDEPARMMSRVHEAGLFECLIPGADLPVDYQIRLSLPSGEQQLYEDPYAFPALITDFDEYLLAEGTHLHMYEKVGAHLVAVRGREGVHFSVWAPNALRVSVIGDFCNWDGRRFPMRYHYGSGIWDIFIPGVGQGALYKYEIKARHSDYTVAKADPVAFYGELRPNTASVVWDLDEYSWGDKAWLAERDKRNAPDQPINVYEVHLGSWRRKEDNAWLTYVELAEQLVPYVKNMGYTHIELLPVAEHPLDGSWGYQVTGYFAPTSRFGTPNEFMALVDTCHQAGIGVILDWVPAHFPRDQHGLSYFDGTFLYEHSDPRRSSHPDWGTLIFNYGRNEVRQFLISNAIFWLDRYHIDGLRVDAVASMLYLDFSRDEGQWIPNRYGGRENLEAIDFIRQFNDAVHAEFPGVATLAEESTAWPGVTRQTADGGLGFDYKWNMGWMHDTLQYYKYDPIYRAYHHGTLTFSLLYAFSERFLLPFSHDEVVHLKRSMLDKMPGDLWQKLANYRTLLAYQIAHPGKKMLFMGGEFGQWREWSETRGLDWHLITEHEENAKLQRFVRQLNHTYQQEPALFEDDNSWDGFAWLDLQGAQRSILAFARNSRHKRETILVAFNLTPVVRYHYRLGVPAAGDYREIMNSDDIDYGGSGVVNGEPLASSPTPWQEQPHSIELTLPPLAAVFIKRAPSAD